MSVKYGIALSTLTLTQVAVPNVVRRLSANNVLNLTGYVYVNYHIELLSNALNLIDQLESNSIIYVFAENTLSLTQTASKIGVIYSNVENILDFQHEAKCSLKVREVQQQLDLQQSVDIQYAISVSAGNNLSGGWEEVDTDELLSIDPYDINSVTTIFENMGLRQEVSLRGSIYNVSAINYLSLSHQAAPTQVGIVSNHLHLSHSIEIVLYEIASNYLQLQQEAICHKVQGVESALELEHEVVIYGIYPESVSNQLNLKSVVSYIVINFCDYAPGIGEGNFDYTPPSITPPTLTRRDTTVLTWPYISPILTIELRNPDFDNTEQFNFRRINRRTRGGTLDLYRDEDWPKNRRLIMSFSRLSDTQRASLFKFIESSIGQEIGLLDFESRQWRGILLTPSGSIAEPVKNGHSFSLEFEGDLV